MNITLISLQRDLDALGLKYIHHYLKSKGYNSSLIFLPSFNGSNERHLEAIRDYIANTSPAFIGMSLMSTEYHSAASLTKCLKGAFRNIPVIWGGIHPTICPEGCLEHADYVCVGEGEETSLDIARTLEKKNDLRGVKNLCYSSGGKVVKNELYPLREDLDEVTYHGQIPQDSFVLVGDKIRPMDLDLFRRYDRYSGRSYISRISRGCPFSCTYCCNNFISNLYNGNRIRKRSIEAVLREIEEAVVVNPGIEYVGFMDDCIPAFDKNFLADFLNSYKRRVGKPFALQSIPTYITRQKLEMMKEAGLSWVSLGLQSGSDRVCSQIYKRKSLAHNFLEAAGHIKELNIAAYYDLILDNPFEDEEDKIETAKTLAKIPKPYFMDFYSLVCYYGTELHERMKRDFPDLADDYLSKDYLLPLGTPLNRLIRSAAFIDSRVIMWLISLYRRNPKGPAFKLSLNAVYMISMIILAPITYLRVLRLSSGGSYLRVIGMLPAYFKLGLFRYLNQFKGRLAVN